MPVARATVRRSRPPSARSMRERGTQAWTMPEKRNPRISAQVTSHAIWNACQRPSPIVSSTSMLPTYPAMSAPEHRELRVELSANRREEMPDPVGGTSDTASYPDGSQRNTSTLVRPGVASKKADADASPSCRARSGRRPCRLWRWRPDVVAVAIATARRWPQREHERLAHELREAHRPALGVPVRRPREGRDSGDRPAAVRPGEG